MKSQQNNIQSVLDEANLHIHKEPLTHEEIMSLGETTEVPEHYLEQSKRIRDIINSGVPKHKDKEGLKITKELAHDLWKIHSNRAFCSCFTSISGVSDKVIELNILSLLQCLEKGIELNMEIWGK